MIICFRMVRCYHLYTSSKFSGYGLPEFRPWIEGHGRIQAYAVIRRVRKPCRWWQGHSLKPLFNFRLRQDAHIPWIGQRRHLYHYSRDLLWDLENEVHSNGLSVLCRSRQLLYRCIRCITWLIRSHTSQKPRYLRTNWSWWDLWKSRTIVR